MRGNHSLAGAAPDDRAHCPLRRDVEVRFRLIDPYDLSMLM